MTLSQSTKPLDITSSSFFIVFLSFLSQYLLLIASDAVSKLAGWLLFLFNVLICVLPVAIFGIDGFNEDVGSTVVTFIQVPTGPVNEALLTRFPILTSPFFAQPSEDIVSLGFEGDPSVASIVRNPLSQCVDSPTC